MKIPLLSSSRLELRPYKDSDFEAFASLNADESVRRHVGGPLSRDDAARRFKVFLTGECLPGNEVWAITLHGSREYVGHCWFVQSSSDETEMGFLIAKRVWAQGYGTEVARLLLDYARGQARYPRLVATVDCDHFASVRILERVGMRRERAEQDEEGAHFLYSMSFERP